MAVINVAAVLGEKVGDVEKAREFQAALLGVSALTLERWEQEEQTFLKQLEKEEQYERRLRASVEEPEPIRRIIAVWS
jgi:hypothetical protein